MTEERKQELLEMSSSVLYNELDAADETKYKAKCERQWKLVKEMELESKYITEIIKERGVLS